MDGSGVRALAASVAGVATEVRRLSGEVNGVREVPWRSRAAELMRVQVGQEGEVLRRLAAALEDASVALQHHAAAVERGPLLAIRSVLS